VWSLSEILMIILAGFAHRAATMPSRHPLPLLFSLTGISSALRAPNSVARIDYPDLCRRLKAALGGLRKPCVHHTPLLGLERQRLPTSVGHVLWSDIVCALLMPAAQGSPFLWLN